MGKGVNFQIDFLVLTDGSMGIGCRKYFRCVKRTKQIVLIEQFITDVLDALRQYCFCTRITKFGRFSFGKGKCF